MTAKEIADSRATDMSTNSWLRELCLQVALLREKTVEAPKPQQNQQRR